MHSVLAGVSQADGQQLFRDALDKLYIANIKFDEANKCE